ncbi:hypothetical protein [Bordetella pseudohinzii]|uniref:YqjK-like protein n=1 Tax=Bordetella pseudohinzii TaxID=1331258 RepID=A0A0J6BYW4_9BORD|nr:hypothetical protein [Bordetella pseudohinzii]ANY16966.1 hypothetical protein BBN53_14410 [Bordetella pseudohinzii]KMM23858.1 hypothetical protein L540_11460 [Bordetella pseudohinzii]KXA75441.1 hypothetical protein AW877_19885 [Bordetella pseudohinzii]KXA75861.1 hypothetical protein AW878_19295 [Bordetella pseudohinzii]CUJ18601.1 Uncharacterised protein [Bordetella pseudohinzii]
MAHRQSPAVERQVRIELLRARAAIEREGLAQSIAEAGQALEPANLVRGLLPRLSQSGASQWMWQAYRLARRYPIVSSAASALFMGGGKRLGALRWAGLGLVGWQLVRAWLKPGERVQG